MMKHLPNIKTNYQVHIFIDGIWVVSRIRGERLPLEYHPVATVIEQLGFFCTKCNEEKERSCFCSSVDNMVLTRRDNVNG